MALPPKCVGVEKGFWKVCLLFRADLWINPLKHFPPEASVASIASRANPAEELKAGLTEKPCLKGRGCLKWLGEKTNREIQGKQKGAKRKVYRKSVFLVGALQMSLELHAVGLYEEKRREQKKTKRKPTGNKRNQKQTSVSWKNYQAFNTARTHQKYKVSHDVLGSQGCKNASSEGQELDELHDSSGSDKCQNGHKAAVAAEDLDVFVELVPAALARHLHGDPRPAEPLQGAEQREARPTQARANVHHERHQHGKDPRAWPTLAQANLVAGRTPRQKV